MSDKSLPEGWATALLNDLVLNKDNVRVPVNAKERAKRPGKVPYYGAAGPVGCIDEALSMSRFCSSVKTEPHFLTP